MLKTLNTLRRQFNHQRNFVRYYPYTSEFLSELDHGPHANVTALANGILAGTIYRDTPHTTIGLYLGAGSRYEYPHENGIMNFFMHAVHKGTKNKTPTDICNEMFRSGASFKCIVEREIVAFTATCLCVDMFNTLELLVCSFYNNLYDPCYLNAIAQHVRQTTIDGEYDTRTLVFDYLHNIAFLGCGLANPILGPTHLLETFNEETITNFLSRAVSTERTAVVAVGNVNHDLFVNYVNCLMCRFDVPCKVPAEYYRFSGSSKMYRDDSMPKCDVAIGFEAPCYCDIDHFALEIAAEILGGWDRSQPPREQCATYIAQAASTENIADCYLPFYFIYTDGGLFGIRFISHAEAVDDMTLNVMHMIRRLCVVAYDGEVERAKRQLKAKILAERMSTARTADRLARDLIYKRQTKSLTTTLHFIDSISPKRIAAVCNHYLYDRCPAVAGIGRTEGIPEYNRLRAGTWSLLY